MDNGTLQSILRLSHELAGPAALSSSTGLDVCSSYFRSVPTRPCVCDWMSYLYWRNSWTCLSRNHGDRAHSYLHIIKSCALSGDTMVPIGYPAAWLSKQFSCAIWQGLTGACPQACMHSWDDIAMHNIDQTAKIWYAYSPHAIMRDQRALCSRGFPPIWSRNPESEQREYLRYVCVTWFGILGLQCIAYKITYPNWKHFIFSL